MQSRVFKRVYPADSEQDRQFFLVTLINMLLPDNPQSKKAVAVGPVSRPILAEKIWHREYVELDKLLLARLGAPGPTVLDVLLQGREGEIEEDEHHNNRGMGDVLQ